MNEHEQTEPLKLWELLLLTGLLALALVGFGAWFWWTWLA